MRQNIICSCGNKRSKKITMRYLWQPRERSAEQASRTPWYQIHAVKAVATFAIGVTTLCIESVASRATDWLHATRDENEIKRKSERFSDEDNPNIFSFFCYAWTSPSGNLPCIKHCIRHHMGSNVVWCPRSPFPLHSSLLRPNVLGTCISIQECSFL
jgi:hypothetical protein